MKRIFFSLLIICLMIIGGMTKSAAQCPMCKSSVESSIEEGGQKGTGLNDGILYLLGAPYLLVCVVGYVWYRDYRRKNVILDIPETDLNMN